MNTNKKQHRAWRLCFHSCLFRVHSWLKTYLFWKSGEPSILASAVSTFTPGTLPFANCTAKFMRASRPAEFSHSWLEFEYPVGSCLRYSGCPSCATWLTSANAKSTSPLTARTALATVSNGDFIFDRYAPTLQN